MPIPRESTLDSTLALLTEGYTFISSRCRQLHSDVFETRIMLRKVICAMGEDAAPMFFAPDRFTRRRAVPPNTLMLLQDFGSAQVLDGEPHHHRKRMFMSLMTPERVAGLTSLFARRWEESLERWSRMEQVVLHQEMETLLCSAACEWVGVPLGEAALRQRTEEFSAMIDGAGAVGPRNWKAMLLRSRTEDWARSIIIGVRARHLAIPADSPAGIIAAHRDAAGELLSVDTAAIELINLVRPVVAVARFITFAALALHDYPEWTKKILGGEEQQETAWFVNEVRRYYPFFPALGGRVLEPFEWRGMRFEKDDWVLLDLYGTNHDPRIWSDPQNFRPERFAQWDQSPFNFIPQGGGDDQLGHRCAGEGITIQLIKRALIYLADMHYEVPLQDLRIDLKRMPALPASRFLLRDVRPAFKSSANMTNAPSVNTMNGVNGVIRSDRSATGPAH
jgi:fatty-acid peroxygenase